MADPNHIFYGRALDKTWALGLDLAKAERRIADYKGIPIKLVDKLPACDGRASRYYPATSEDHDAMNDLTLHAAPKGGYTVQNYDDDVVFAGTLEACLDHLREHFLTVFLEAEAAAKKAADEKAKLERLAEREERIARIRRGEEA